MKKALGTAGSLSLINLKNLEDGTIILNADTIFDLNLIDLINFHKKKIIDDNGHKTRIP